MSTLTRRNKTLALMVSGGLLWCASAGAAPAIEENPSAVREQAERINAEASIENSLPAAEQKPQGTSFTLSALTVEQEAGLKVKQTELESLVAAYVGKTVTLAELNEAAAKLTRYCRAHGYPAATAYLPPQTSADGAIRIAVAPGRYGRISIDNRSKKLKTAVIKRLTHGLRSGDVIEGKKLETALYNIIGLGGVKAGGMLRPGANSGESDVVILVEDGKQETYVLYVNNQGSKAAGRYRYGFTADWYELGGNGEHLGVNGMLSNKRQKNFGIRYDQETGHSGTRLGLGVSYANYELGARLAALGAKGTATTISFYGSTPLYRTTNNGLNFSYGVDYRDMNDKLNNFGIRTDKKSYAAHLGINGFQKDKHTLYAYDLKGYWGHLSGDMKAFGLTVPLTQEGSYAKGTLEASLLHSFAPRWDILVKTSAQLAGKDLDSSEEMYLGGATGVRAYPQGEGSGDSGYQATTELRYHTGVPGLILSTYFDIGHVNAKGNNAVPRNTTLKGWGVGLTWMRTNDFFARLDYARRIGMGNNVSQDAEAKGRFWFTLGKVW